MERITREVDFSLKMFNFYFYVHEYVHMKTDTKRLVPNPLALVTSAWKLPNLSPGKRAQTLHKSKCS